MPKIEHQQLLKFCNQLLSLGGMPAEDADLVANLLVRGEPRGVFLPFGGYKGSGIALITEILGGILSGNGMGKTWWNNGGHGVNGLFLQAFAVEEFQALETFYDKVDELIALIKSTPCAPGFSEILLPGEAGRRREATNQRDGVEIDDATWTGLTDLADKLNVKDVPVGL